MRPSWPRRALHDHDATTHRRHPTARSASPATPQCQFRLVCGRPLGPTVCLSGAWSGNRARPEHDRVRNTRPSTRPNTRPSNTDDVIRNTGMDKRDQHRDQNKGDDLSSALRDAIADTVADLGVALVSVEVKGPRNKRVVKLVADADDGLDVDRIAAVSHAVGGIADDVVPGSYTLEVSSPGVERPLTTPAHFTRNLGRRVEVRHNAGDSDTPVSYTHLRAH